MNENQLQSFLTIAKYRSYSKAAVALNVTQPTITFRIKALEDILGCKLFSRSGHEIFLTKEGNMFIEYAKNISFYMNQSKEITNILKDPIIKVGFSPGYSYSFIVELLKLIKSIGGIDIKVIEGYDSVDLNKRALAGEVDLIFTREALPNSHDIISEYLFDSNPVVIIPKSHPLNNKQDLCIEDLDGETIISFKRDSPFWELIDEQLIGVQNATRIDVDNNEMLIQAVVNEIGIGIAPELGIDEKYRSEIKIHKIKEIHDIPNKVIVQYRKSSQISSLAKKLIYSVINYKYTAFPQ
ncbi:DNA-binding transcriptional LysR family regulator [Virgibacillus halotolerans]|uniref:LysR family transcriptional regulator n=1 Tax=Virgibacillus halotolerans TaxID=1071053 RepID=UPI0019617C6E|nr:LysR family transcriptional regulator [Virgibacillus halotolerans]MBM7599200.1 DNA-binding transcriptional LysR family regulator [Virgibacillus halotolerans]